MTLSEACKIANEELEKFGRGGLTEIRDLGDCWFFWGGDPNVKPLGITPVIIFKESGRMTDWMDLVFIMKRDDTGPSLPIPPSMAYQE